MRPMALQETGALRRAMGTPHGRPRSQMKGSGMPVCRHCGAEHKERARFCQNCGVEIAAEPALERQAAGGNPENAAPPGPTPDPAAFSPDRGGVAAPDAMGRLQDWTTRTVEQVRDQVDRGVLGDYAMTQGTVVEIMPGTDWKSGGFSKGYELKQILVITYRLADGTEAAAQVDALRGPVLTVGDEIRVYFRIKGAASLVSGIENLSRGTSWKARKRIL